MNLDLQIQGWRERLHATGTISSEALDELESGLRDAIEECIRSGLDSQAAFDQARRRLGGVEELAGEFAKVDTRALVRARVGWMIAGATILSLWIAFGGLASQVARRVEFWARFHANPGEATTLATFVFWTHASMVGLIAKATALLSLGIGIRQWSLRPSFRRGLERLQSDTKIQAGLLIAGALIPSGLLLAVRPPPVTFPDPLPESVTRMFPTPLDFLLYCVSSTAFLLLVGVFIWLLGRNGPALGSDLWDRAQQLAHRHIFAWMTLGIVLVNLLGFLVGEVGRLTFGLVAMAIEALGLSPLFDLELIGLAQSVGMVLGMSGTALLGLRVLQLGVPHVNKSRLLGLMQSSPGWLLVSLFVTLGFVEALPLAWWKLQMDWLSHQRVSSSLFQHSHVSLLAWGGVLLRPCAFVLIAASVWPYSSKKLRPAIESQPG